MLELFLRKLSQQQGQASIGMFVSSFPLFCLPMEEALFRVTITLANFLQKLVWLKLLSILSDTDVNILTLIKLKVEAGQRQHYIANINV